MWGRDVGGGGLKGGGAEGICRGGTGRRGA